MRVTKYRPFRGSSSLDHFFDNIFGTQLSEFIGGDVTSSMPSANISEVDGGYEIELAIPGLAKEDVHIEVDNKTLIIKGKKVSEEGTPSYSKKEFNFSAFERRFFLGEDIDLDNIAAKHEHGILSVSLTKVIDTQEKKIIVID